MPYPNDLKANGTGVADNDLLFTTGDVSSFNEHNIQVTAGSVDIEVAIDEGADSNVQFSDSSTFPIAVMLLNATNPSTWVTQIDAGQIAVLTGRFDRIRVRQKGATGAVARISSYRNR